MARLPHTNSTRQPCFTFSVLRSRMHPICPVPVTWVPPHAVFFDWRECAEPKSFCLFLAHEPNVHGTVLHDHIVGQRLGGFDLLLGKTLAFEVDGTIVRTHVKGNRWHIEEANKG